MFPDLHASLQMHEQQRPQHCGLASMPEAIEERHQGLMQETLGSGAVYLHISSNGGGNSALPVYGAGYKSLLLFVLGQTADIFATQLVSWFFCWLAPCCQAIDRPSIEQASWTATLVVKESGDNTLPDSVKDPWQGF